MILVQRQSPQDKIAALYDVSLQSDIRTQIATVCLNGVFL